MSLFVLAPETVWNPSILKFPTAPRKILQRGIVVPRREVSLRFVVRMMCESLALRCIIVLLPFCIAGLIWPAIALPLGQAPIAMIFLIALVETRLLRMSDKKRKDVVAEADAARVLDTLQFRGRRILAQLAAKRGIENGTIYLVVEQSDMVRLPPMTLASLQLDEGRSRLVPLDAAERAIIRDGLFDADFTEHDLFLANQREGVAFRSVAFETRGVSAHARLAAFLDATPAGAEVPA
ncbi:MAG: hypothetical protein AAGF56_06640 [Pseudomonadota bacterium]